MPIYEYKCEKCGHEISKLVKMDAPAPACEKCAEAGEEQPMKKKVSETGFHLGGGGWAKDGYG